LNAPRQRGHDEDALLIAVLTAFPDRVARRRAGSDLLMSSGGAARLSPASTVTRSELLVAVDIEERTDRGLPLVRLASAIEPEWLIELFPDRVREEAAVEWNRPAERVEEVSRLLYDQLPLEEKRRPPDPAAAARLLAEKAIEAGLSRFAGPDGVAEYLARVAFAASHSKLEPLPRNAVEKAIESLSNGLTSLSDLERVATGGGLIRALEAQLGPDGGRILEQVAPERIRLPGGRNVRVRYAAGQPPWIASRLQDFFGMRETPRIARGHVPLVVHLLAPNQRPVQTTTDLAGFWSRLYPEVRRALSRRYPRHAWPEDPLRESA
jgi:ATP-dependent helicase HrpB